MKVEAATQLVINRVYEGKLTRHVEAARGNKWIFTLLGGHQSRVLVRACFQVWKLLYMLDQPANSLFQELAHRRKQGSGADLCQNEHRFWSISKGAAVGPLPLWPRSSSQVPPRSQHRTFSPQSGVGDGPGVLVCELYPSSSWHDFSSNDIRNPL